MIISIPIGAPHGCVLGPLLYFLLTYNCTAKWSSSVFFKLAYGSNTADSVAVKMVTSWRGQQPLSLSISLKLKIWSWNTGNSKEVDISPSRLMNLRLKDSSTSGSSGWKSPVSFANITKSATMWCRLKPRAGNRYEMMSAHWTQAVREEAATAFFSSSGHQKIKTTSK